MSSLTRPGFSAQALPNEAQTFPLLSVHAVDLNQDGRDDLICAGSIYDMEVETPRLDAGTGLVLLSDGTEYILDRSGAYDIQVSGEVKSMIPIVGPDQKNYLVVGRNNAALGLLGL